MAVDTSSPGFVIALIPQRAERHIVGSFDPNVSERVLSFVYEDSEATMDVLKLTVDNHDFFFLENPLWVKGNIVRFYFGYPGAIFGPRDHVIDSVQGFLTLEITATERTALSNEAKNRTFEGMTRSQVVQQLVNEGAFQGVTAYEIDETNLKAEPARDWQQSRQTDWQFVQKLAEDPGFQVYVEGEKLYFVARKLNTRPVRRYEYFYGDGALKDFDITEWRTADRPAEADVASRDPLEREDFTARGSNETTSRTVLGNQSTLVLKAGRDGGLVAGREIVTTPERNKTTVTNQADARYRLQEEGEVVARATIIGDPLLKAKQVVEIQGLSKISGKYYIKKHTHTITPADGYVGELELIKNALTSMPTSDPPTLDPTKAKQNTQAATQDRRLTIVPDQRTGELRQEYK